MKSLYYLPLAVGMACLSTTATAQGLPQGENCELTDPPSTAGESYVALQGIAVMLRVYPRLSQIDDRYTGCQVSWISSSARPGKVDVARILIVRGLAVSVWPAVSEPMCKKGEKASKTGCSYPTDFLSASSYPGCLATALGKEQMSKECLNCTERWISTRNWVAEPSAKMRPNPSLKAPTRYGSHRLAAPGLGVNCPSAARRRLPPRAS